MTPIDNVALVIHDQADERNDLRRLISSIGLQTLVAENGSSGIKIALDEVPDIILCAERMAKIDGYDVQEILQKNSSTAQLPFIFLVNPNHTKRQIKSGKTAEDYLFQPFSQDALVQIFTQKLGPKHLGEAAIGPGSRLQIKEGIRSLKAAFMQFGRTTTFQKKENIVQMGDPVAAVYAILDGHVHLRRTHQQGKDYIFSELKPSDYFGMISLIYGKPFTFSAQVASDTCTCAILPRKNFLELLQKNPAVTATVMRQMAGRLLEGSEQLVSQAYDSVKRRTAVALCDLYNNHKEQTFTVSREDLAQMVGSTKESVIRALSDFKKSGLVSIKGSKIEILQIAALRNLLL